jgi:hypothetical protein
VLRSFFCLKRLVKDHNFTDSFSDEKFEVVVFNLPVDSQTSKLYQLGNPILLVGHHPLWVTQRPRWVIVTGGISS